MSRTLQLEGERFGQLVVTKAIGTNTHHQQIWECHCDCGGTKVAVGSQLKKGVTTSCGHTHGGRRAEAVRSKCLRCGEEFFTYATINNYCKECQNLNRKDRSRAHYKKIREQRAQAGVCVSCGHLLPEEGLLQCRKCLDKPNGRRARLIRLGLCIRCGGKAAEQGARQCQGCLDKEKEERKIINARLIKAGLCIACRINHIEEGKTHCIECGEKARNRLAAAASYKISQYKLNAKNRGHRWELSDEQALDLFSQPCYICGKKPPKRGYNGIDRVDNSVGYTYINSKPCCGPCNKKKSTCTVNAAMRVVEHQLKIGDESTILWLNKLTRGEDRE